MEPQEHPPHPDRSRQVERLFGAALDRAPEDRVAYLEAACADDPALRAEVVSLLEAYEASEDFLLEVDVGEVLARLVGAPVREGRRIGPYRVLGELGRGGMGAVYLAERADGSFEQQVALKLIKRGMDSEAILQRFLTERQILARLQHPNIARLLDGGVSDDGQPYFAMAYVEGRPITRYCDSRALDVEGRLRLFQGVCRAVHYAHRNLVVHRDLKPSNILVTGEGQVKLLDFGIAKLLEPEQEGSVTSLTEAGLRALTPEYAAPEQVQGEPSTTATDVYALGVLLYELLTGRRPYHFARRTPEEVARVICHQDPERPSTAVARVREVLRRDGEAEALTPERVGLARGLRPDRLRRRLAGDLDTMVLMALRKEPERRYASAEAFLEDVRRHLAGLPVQARKDTLGYRAATFVRRHRVGTAAALLVALSLFFGLAGTAWQATVAAEERDRARLEAAKAREVKDFVLGLFEASNPVLEAKGDTVTARELLERGVVRIEEELGGQPEVRAEMLGVVAKVYQELGRYDRAEPLLAQALSLRQQRFGRAHPDVAQSLYDLATLMRYQGDYAAAESLHVEALALRRRLLYAAHPDIAESANGLAMALHYQGRHAAAEPYYREALALYEERHGEENQEVVAILNNLAVLLFDQGDYAAAESLYRKALALRRGLLGDEHPHVALSLNNLAGMLYDQGDYAAAESLHVEALAMRRKLLGPQHPDVAYSLIGLAKARRQQGDYAAAESLYGEALAMQRMLLGDEHPHVVGTLNNLAVLLRYKGDFAAAEPLFRKVLALDRKQWGEEHHYVAFSLDNLAAVLVDKGEPAAALGLFRQAGALYRRLLGPEHPERATNLTGQARALRLLGRREEALSLLEEALRIYRTRLGGDHPKVAATLDHLGAIRFDLLDYAAADTLYRQALALQRAGLPAGHVERAVSLVGLGQVALAQRHPHAAEPLLREALEIRRQALPEGHWQQAEAQSVLGACLSALGRVEEAGALLEAGYAGLEGTRGTAHPLTRHALQRLTAHRQGPLARAVVQ